MKTANFLILIAFFIPIISIVYLFLTFVLFKFTEDYYYSSVCAVGASGVIFALKVVANDISPNSTHYIMGFFPIKAKYAAWGELIIIYILVPQSSFTGHLAGILVGFAYCHLNIFKNLIAIFTSPFGKSFNLNKYIQKYVIILIISIGNTRNTFVGGAHRFRSTFQDEHTRRETRNGNSSKIKFSLSFANTNAFLLKCTNFFH